MEGNIIAIIGAPGTGKSFLVKKLAEKLNAIAILEEEIPIPDKIIDNFKNDLNQMETLIWFRNKCVREIEKAIELKNAGKIIVMDTFWISNEFHIKSMTSGFEEEILMEQADIDRKHLPFPDFIIYLDASEETIRNLTIKRGRDYDTNERFIQRNLIIKKEHDKYYQENKEGIIYINRDNLDFEKEEDIQAVIDKLN